MADIKSISERCIKHQQKYHIQVRKEYVEMMDGDTCSAILIWLFDFLDDNETTRMRVAEEEGIPWIKASFSSITQSLLGLYAERSIRDRIHFLRGLGILKVAPHSGKINLYQIDIDVLNEALTKRKIFTFDPGKIAGVPTDGKIAVEDETPAKPPAKLPGSEDLSISVLERRKDAAAADAPPEPVSEESQTLPEESVATFRDFRVVWEKALGRMSAGERGKATEYFSSVRMSVAALTGAVERFASWLGKKKNIRDPLAFFFKNPQSWGDFESPLVNGSGLYRAKRWAEKVDALPPSSVSATVDESEYPRRWNEVVKAAPIDYSPRNGPRKPLLECIANPDFVSRFDEVCELAQRIHEARGKEASWITFPFILGNSNGKGYGWWRVLTEFRSMAEPKPKPRSRSSDLDGMAARALEILRKKKEANQ